MANKPVFPAGWTNAEVRIPFTNAPDEEMLMDERHFNVLDLDGENIANRIGYDKISGAYFYRGRRKVYLHRFVMGRDQDISDKRVGFLDRNNKNCCARNLFIYSPEENRLAARRVALIERGYLKCED